MTDSRRMLLETLAGHFAWLRDAHPQAARSPAARRASRHVRSRLRVSPTPKVKVA